MTLLEIPIERRAAAGVVPAVRSYFVTNWETAEVKEIIFRDDSFEKFLFSIGVSFHMGMIRRLYALYPGTYLEDRVQITNKDQLLEIFAYIDQHQDDSDAMQVLYVYPKNESPVITPVKGPPASRFPLHDEQKSESSGSRGESAKSDRSTYQERFAREVKWRDKEQCRICGINEVLEACHIVDVEAKLSIAEFDSLGLVNRYEIWNGITFCATCHRKYDYWKHGIDEEGYLWKKEGKKWARKENVNIYPDPSVKNLQPKYPDPRLLKWKFDRFLINRDKVMSRINYGLSALSLTLTKGSK